MVEQVEGASLKEALSSFQRLDPADKEVYVSSEEVASALSHMVAEEIQKYSSETPSFMPPVNHLINMAPKGVQSAIEDSPEIQDATIQFYASLGDKFTLDILNKALKTVPEKVAGALLEDPTIQDLALGFVLKPYGPSGHSNVNLVSLVRQRWPLVPEPLRTTLAPRVIADLPEAAPFVGE